MSCARDFIFPAALSFLLLVGCSNQQEPSPLREIVVQAVSGRGHSENVPPVAQQSGFLAVSPQIVATETDPVVGVVLEARGAQALLTPSGQSGNLTTWLSADRASFAFTGGTILVRTSGLGNDLQNAEFSELLMVMSSGQSGTARREHIYLTRDFQQERRVFACDVTLKGPAAIRIGAQNFSTIHFEESCRYEDNQFTNAYWIDRGTGLIVQSIQWVHQDTGKAHFQIINN